MEEKRKHYLIYRITNLINGKIYIGKHETFDPDDGYMGSGKILKRAQLKYDLENFQKDILFDFQTEDEMNAKEKELVNESFVAREDTYNIMVGGHGGFDYINRNDLQGGKAKHGGQLWVNISGQNKNGLKQHIRLFNESEEYRQRFCKSVADGLAKHFQTHHGSF